MHTTSDFSLLTAQNQRSNISDTKKHQIDQHNHFTIQVHPRFPAVMQVLCLLLIFSCFPTVHNLKSTTVNLQSVLKLI